LPNQSTSAIAVADGPLGPTLVYCIKDWEEAQIGQYEPGFMLAGLPTAAERIHGFGQARSEPARFTGSGVRSNRRRAASNSREHGWPRPPPAQTRSRPSCIYVPLPKLQIPVQFANTPSQASSRSSLPSPVSPPTRRSCLPCRSGRRTLRSRRSDRRPSRWASSFANLGR
jgi:hypothetical protein